MIHNTPEDEPDEEDWVTIHPEQEAGLRKDYSAEEGPLRPGWEIYMGTGPEGFGLYAHRPEDSGKDVVCLATFDPDEYPEASQIPRKVSAEDSSSTPMSTRSTPIQWTWKGSLKPQVEEGVAQFVISRQDFSIPVPNFKSAQRIATMLNLVESNARAEIARELRDRINEMIVSFSKGQL